VVLRGSRGTTLPFINLFRNISPVEPVKGIGLCIRNQILLCLYLPHYRRKRIHLKYTSTIFANGLWAQKLLSSISD